MMTRMLEQMLRNMEPGQLRELMQTAMPRTMDHCLSRMDGVQRREMLGIFREMLDQIEARYPAEPA